MMQISRLFGIVYLLMEKKGMTAQQLAERFEVSTRTILRDVETLSMSGIPIYTSKGKGGGIYLMDGFVLNKATISEEEQNQILAALQGMSSTEHYSAETLLSKLGALFQKTDTNWIEVDYSRWGSAESDRDKFELLKNAVLNGQAISFAYPSPYRQTLRRRVHPLKLVFKSRAWYLKGYCLLRKDYRLFKISRMLHPELLEEHFDPSQYAPPPLELYDSSSEALVNLTLRFSPSTAYRIYDEFDMDSVQEQEDGSFLVSLCFPEDYWFYGFLLSYGADVTVLAPAHVRERLLRELEKIKAQYLV